MSKSRPFRVFVRVLKIAISIWLIGYVLSSVLTGLYLLGALHTFDPRITPAGYGVADYEEVRLPSRDPSLMLAGWYLPNASSQRAVVLVHGKDASRTQEMQGQFTEFAAALHRRGFAILMIELRGHGQSDYGPLTFGQRERLMCWARSIGCMRVVLRQAALVCWGCRWGQLPRWGRSQMTRQV